MRRLNLPWCLYEWRRFRLTNRWSQPLVVVKSTFDFMKQFLMLATPVAASGGSAPSRWAAWGLLRKFL